MSKLQPPPKITQLASIPKPVEQVKETHADELNGNLYQPKNVGEVTPVPLTSPKTEKKKATKRLLLTAGVASAILIGIPLIGQLVIR